MMLSPDAYRNSIEDYDIDELVKERNALLKSIKRFEKHQITDDERMIHPSPRTVYHCNNEYLIEVTKLINARVLEMRDMIPLERTQRLNLKETDFRSIYKEFVAYPLTKGLRGIIKDFPHANRANCVLAYGYIDTEAGLTLELLAAGKKTEDGFLFYDSSADTRSIVRIGHVVNEDFYRIDDAYDELADRYADKLEVLEHYEADEEVEEARKMDFLDSCRNPEFPDDVLVYLVRNGLQPEGCWARIIGLGEEFMVAILLNEPNQDFGYHVHEKIAFFCETTKDHKTICIANMNPSRTLTAEDLADGTMLKNAITSFNNERTQDNFFEILELLRDSYVWIPCRAILSDSDYSKWEKMIKENDGNLDSLAGLTLTNADNIRMVPDILQNGDDFFFPVFTSCEEMGEYGDSFSKIEKHFLEAIVLAKNNEKNVRGIVINACSEPFILEKDLFDLIEKAKSRLIES